MKRKKLVLKPFVVPTLYVLFILIAIILAVKMTYKEKPKEEPVVSVDESIFETIVPVINDDTYVLNPYSGENVTVNVDFYRQNDNSELQESSIIKYESTYLQNSGLTFKAEKPFEIIAVMEGEVTKVYSNDILGNVIEITHENNIKTLYQSVSNVKVSEGQMIHAGEVIAESGTSKIFDNGNYLYFEVVKDGSIIDPNRILGQNTKNI